MRLAGDVISSPAIVPGIHIDRGTLIVDRSQLKWRGDLLHEARPLAILLRNIKMVVTGTAGKGPGFEMAAMLRWMGMIADERQFPAMSHWLRE